MMSSKDLLDLEPNHSESEKKEGLKRLENDKRIYILSIVSLFLYIPIGTFMAIFSIIRGNEELDEYRINPELYNQESYDYVSKGRIIGIVSLILQIVSIPLFIVLSLVMK
jgi:hypothetical protein